MIENSMIAYVVFGVMAVVRVVFFEQFNNRALKKNLARIKKSGKLPYQPNITLTFFEDCFVEKTDVNETKTNYSMLERIDETDTAVYIYTGAVTAFIVPNRIFGSDNEQAAFIAYLQTKITRN